MSSAATVGPFEAQVGELFVRSLDESLCHAFLRTARRRGDATAHRWRADGEWRLMSWTEYRRAVAATASGLRAMGVERGDRVALLMRNRPEFHVVDLACLFLGAVPISIYPNLGDDQMAYVLEHSGISTAVAEDAASLARFTALAERVPALRRYGVIEPAGVSPDLATFYSQLLEHDPLDLDAAAASRKPTDLATVIYTSGTTGVPKGVRMLDATAYNACVRLIDRMGVDAEGFRVISYLPMAHSGERTASHYPQLIYGFDVASCPSLSDVSQYLVEIKPNWWPAAPRFWEKQRGEIEAVLAGDPPLRDRFDAARANGMERFSLRNDGRPVPGEIDDRYRRDRAEVIEPVLSRFGLDQVRVVTCGSAPMAQSLQEWWIGLGVLLADIYGMTETLMISYDTQRIVPGTVGTPLAGVETRLAADGELLVRTPTRFAGYLNDPEGTTAVLEPDGWFHTGDIAEFDGEGNLRIIDRKKNVIVPSSGHNVSPTALETALKEHELIGQACVVGDGRPYCAALIVLDPTATPDWAQARSLSPDSLEQLLDHPLIREEIGRHVQLTNSRLPRAEQIGAFEVLGEEWTADSGLLTPTLKMKRPEIARRFVELIEAMYDRPDARNG